MGLPSGANSRPLCAFKLCGPLPKYEFREEWGDFLDRISFAAYSWNRIWCPPCLGLPKVPLGAPKTEAQESGLSCFNWLGKKGCSRSIIDFLVANMIRPMRFGSRRPSEFVLETWIRNRNALTEKAWEDGQSCFHLYNVIITELSNNHGDGLLWKRHLKSRAASNFIALIPSRLIHQMLANFFDVEF